MTNPPVPSKESTDFEGIGRLYVENNQLKKRIDELESEKSKNLDYKQRYHSKCEECDELKEENKKLTQENTLLKQQSNCCPQPKFQYIFDITDYNENMDISDIEQLQDKCLELAETKCPRGYLIESSLDILVLFLLLAEKGVFRRHGKSDKDNRNWGLTAFCHCWDNNIVPRIADIKRQEELHSDLNKIKKELNRDLWKNSTSCSWNNLYNNCGYENGQSAKRKAKLGRALNIKKRLEKLIETIPILKSKRY